MARPRLLPLSGDRHGCVLVRDKPAGFDQVGIAWARSPDGITFTEVDHDIAPWKTTAWTASNLLAPTMLFDGNQLLLWFAGQGILAPPNWWADFESGIARLEGTEACGRPTVVLTRDAGPALLPGDTVTITATVDDPEGTVTTLDWQIASTSAPGVDCSAEVNATAGAGDTLTISVPVAYTDVRCADELMVTATASGGSRNHSDSIGFSVAAPDELGIVWTEVPGNPILPLSVCPEWDCLDQADPTLGRAANGDLNIWYSSGGDQGGPVVGRINSSGGGPFAKAPDAPVMEPDSAGVPPDPLPWDYFRETVSARWNPTLGAWNMLYLGYQTDYFTDPAIGLTLSSDADGTVFPRMPVPIYTPARPGSWDDSFLTSPSAVYGSDGVWRLYFVGASFGLGGGMKVGVLTSIDDGQSWVAGPPSRANPIFEGAPGQWDESILDCFVHFIGGRYMMWYTSFREPFSFDAPFSIGLATSEDGYTWQRHAGNPIIGPGPTDSWNDRHALDGEVIIEADGSLTMSAYGSSSIPPNPSFPDFKPSRIGLWRSTAP